MGKQKSKITVKLMTDSGTTKSISYDEIKEHNLLIIDDNTFFGHKLVSQGQMKPEEVKKYRDNAIVENSAFLKIIREDKAAIVKMNESTQLYEIVKENEQ